MRHVLFACFLIVLATGCAQLRYAETGIGQAIDNPVTQTYTGVKCTVVGGLSVLRSR